MCASMLTCAKGAVRTNFSVIVSESNPANALPLPNTNTCLRLWRAVHTIHELLMHPVPSVHTHHLFGFSSSSALVHTLPEFLQTSAHRACVSLSDSRWDNPPVQVCGVAVPPEVHSAEFIQKPGALV